MSGLCFVVLLCLAGQCSELVAVEENSQSNSIVLSEWPSDQASLFHLRIILIPLTAVEGVCDV